MQHHNKEAGSNNGGSYSVKSYEKAVSDSSRAEHIQDVHVQYVKKWPGTESLSAEYRSLPHPAPEGAEDNKIKMPSSTFMQTVARGKFIFTDENIFNIEEVFNRQIDWVYASISRETHDMSPRIQRDHHPSSVMVLLRSVIGCHHQISVKREENLC